MSIVLLITTLALSIIFNISITGAAFSSQPGICYGQLGNNLQPPPKSAELIKSLKAKRVKIYDANPEILNSLKNTTNLQVSIIVPNEIISLNQTFSDHWVLTNVVPFHPHTLIRYLLVGNEVINSAPNSTWPHLVPAMRRIKRSLTAFGIRKVKVGTSSAMDVLGTSFPPSNGSFREDIAGRVMKPMLQFLNHTKSFFFLDVYPFFAWSSNPVNIDLDYALFRANNITVSDPGSGLVYTNLFDQMVDAVYFAISRLGFPGIRIFIAETGWPNGGDIDQIEANVFNAATYNRNFVKKVMTKPAIGTPARPGSILLSYLFALYNENQKSGPGTERNFGLLYPNGSRIYDIDLSGETPESEFRALPPPENNKPYKGKIWCVAERRSNATALAAALSYACSQGNRTCDKIRPEKPCSRPDSVLWHASYAFSSYWAQYKKLGGTCYFNGLWRLLRARESLLCQKSRCKWIQEGDMNSKYFHGYVNRRRQKNHLVGLRIQGEWVENPIVVKKEVNEFFEERFKEKTSMLLTLDGIPFKCLSPHDNVNLCAKFDPQEVKEAVWDCDGDKSPGPDGFNFKFIKEFWHVLATDVLKALEDFHGNGVWPRGSNSSFIAMVPKNTSPQSLEEFRPISLVGCLYKIVAKLLANRLKGVLTKVISEEQSAFLQGRDMLDTIVIANEVVHEAKEKRKPTMAFKVDFEKAYDSVRWEFLFYMMRRMRFNERWIGWIKGCLSSARISVLVNGSPSEEFGMERGLRQGDPMAPFLYLIVAEGLNGLFKQALTINKFSGYKVGAPNGIEISILQFADDTLFFGEASIQNVQIIKCILRCFEIASGLKVNFHKSKLAGLAMDGRRISRLTALLNCKTMSTPFTYLGIQVGGNPKRLAFWDPVVNRLKNRLTKWRQKTLSMGGRLILIGSVLSSISLYYLSFYRMPPGIVKKCRTIMRAFMWGEGADGHNKISWVKWEDICKPKDMGGLGLRDWNAFNKALLSKWRWILQQEEDSLWGKVLKSKYHVPEVGEVATIKGRISGWWRDIITTCYTAPSAGWFDSNIRKEIGEGNSTRFWQEAWLNQERQVSKHRRLFNLSEQKQCTVKEMGRWLNGKWVWEFKWRRQLLERETGWEQDLLATLDQAVIKQDQRDKWLWVPTDDGIYTVKSGYSCAMNHCVHLPISEYDNLWQVHAPTNAIVFVWKAMKGRIQTMENLQKRGVGIIAGQNLCSFCLTENETLEHLLFTCKASTKVWNLCNKWMGQITVMPVNCISNLQQCNFGFGSRKQIRRARTVWVAVVWSIWLHRNSIRFNDGNLEVEKIFEMAQLRSWNWLHAKVKEFKYSLYDWQVNPRYCIVSL